MDEFSSYIYLLPLSLEVIAAIAATVYYKKYSHTVLKFILPYLWLIICTEFSYMTMSSLELSLVWLFNILTLAEYSLYFYIYFSYLSIATHKKIVKLFWIIFYIIFIVDMLFLQQTYQVLYNNVQFSGSFFLVVSIILYFKEVLNSDKVMNLPCSLLTWVSAGMLFYHVVSLPMSAIINDLGQLDSRSKLYIRLIYALPSVILYTSYILGFVWSKKECHN